MTQVVGVLGLGSIGMRHARNLMGLGAEVIGFDPSPERRALLEQQGRQAVDDAKEVLQRCSVVVIATPSGNHLEDLDRAVDAGCHVMLEKPIAHQTDGLDGVLGRAEDRGLVVFAAMNMRFHPVVRAARDLISAERLGKPVWARLLAASYLPDWRPHQDYRDNYATDPKTGGVLFDFIHEFDLAHHLFGIAEVVGASARSSGLLDMPSEDIADVILKHAGGMTSMVHVDYVTRPRQRDIQVGLDGGVMALNLEAGHLTATTVDGVQLHDQSFVYDPNDMYVEEMKAFLTSVNTGGTPLCPGREALSVLKTVIAARRMCGLPE